MIKKWSLRNNLRDIKFDPKSICEGDQTSKSVGGVRGGGLVGVLNFLPYPFIIVYFEYSIH